MRSSWCSRRTWRSTRPAGPRTSLVRNAALRLSGQQKGLGHGLALRRERRWGTVGALGIGRALNHAFQAACAVRIRLARIRLAALEANLAEERHELHHHGLHGIDGP